METPVSSIVGDGVDHVPIAFENSHGCWFKRDDACWFAAESLTICAAPCADSLVPKPKDSNKRGRPVGPRIKVLVFGTANYVSEWHN